MNFLTEHDIDSVGIPYLELPDLVGAIRRLVDHVSPSIPDLPKVRVHVTYPLKKMDARGGH